MAIIRWLDKHIEEVILVALLVLIACVELAQVICRNVPALPTLQWAEELCRFAWIATVFISLPYTIRNSNELRVSALIDALPDHVHNALNILVDIVNAGIMGVLAYQSVGVFQSVYSSGETSSAMLWPMWIMYAFILVGFTFGCLRALQMMVIHIIKFDERPITYIEEQISDETAEEWVRPATISQRTKEVDA